MIVVPCYFLKSGTFLVFWVLHGHLAIEFNRVLFFLNFFARGKEIILWRSKNLSFSHNPMPIFLRFCNMQRLFEVEMSWIMFGAFTSTERGEGHRFMPRHVKEAQNPIKSIQKIRLKLSLSFIWHEFEIVQFLFGLGSSFGPVRILVCYNLFKFFYMSK